MQMVGTEILANIIMINPKQLTFPWTKPNRSELEDFFFDEKNLKLKDILLSDEDFYLYGGNKVGKTYLMQSLCNLYAKKDKTSLYIPLKDILNLDTSLLESLDSLETISPNNLAGKVIAPLFSIEAEIEVCIPKLRSKPVNRSFPVTSSAANKTFANTGCVGRLETALLTN